MNRDDVARLTPLQRRALLDELAEMVKREELRLGEAARILRSAVLGMDRDTFARAVKVSKRAIAVLEDDPDANPTLQTLSRVFKPFGARLGLVFPRATEPAPLTDERTRLREMLQQGLEKSRRRPRGRGPKAS